ncbi:hypothetical protein ACCAA_520023 [Candidatus Accumulibacter aalborgensis]|uniref:Uncharacterized protein n=1 Tax=Candidatus Accumulibacter aalborgensis TaxID=1860102 RepID=A0A1A8XSL7_9PROT|nr:hypothetical protein [Candidatus Accumulibacter aalborgensis]SBT08094.1 hypothetical protein ACCAA_520023 [Candidatus Accumulibacter aalborgensis]
MVEIPKRRSHDELRHDAQCILRRSFSVWPDKFLRDEIADLMSGGWSRDKLQQEECRKWRKIAIEAEINGWLLVSIEKQEPITRLKKTGEFAEIFGMPARVAIPRTTQPVAKCYIFRQPCADWLKERGINPSEEVLEWLRIGGIIFGQTAATQANDCPAEDEKKATSIYSDIQEDCRKVFQELWKIRPDMTITGDGPNGSVQQPEVARFLNGRKKEWIMEQARETAPEHKKKGGRPPKKL